MKTYRYVIVVLLTAVSVGELQAQSHFNIENRLAIEGYDPVAYFISGKAIEGKKEISAQVAEVNYRFDNTSNKKLFQQDPQKYQPQYGGWCAYAMGANGEKVEVDPGTFKVVDNKLYLFYNAYFNNTLKKWNGDEANLKRMADANWNKIIK
jgi:hypothetical protein